MVNRLFISTRQLAIILVVLLFGERGFAQEVPIFKWAKQTGRGAGYEYAWDVTTDASGNVFSTGGFGQTTDASTAPTDFDPGTSVFNLTSNAASTDIFISKLDANGNFLWAKSIGGSGQDEGQGIITDAAENIYITGYFSNTIDFDPGPSVFNLTGNGTDLFILKLTSSGDFVWAKNFDQDYGNSIAYDPVGFIYVATSRSFGSCAVLKLDTDGNLIWTRNLSGTTGGNAVSVDGIGGNIVVTGWLNGTADFDPGAGTLNLTSSGVDKFIWKLDANGNLVWAKQLDGGSISLYRSGSSLDALGNIYLSDSFSGTLDFDPGPGSFTLTSTGTDVFVCKLNSSGDFQWAKRIDAAESNFIVSDASGNSYVTGYFTSTIDFDPGAGTYNLTSAGNQDIFILKLDPNGDFAWATRNGSLSTDKGSSLHADSFGNVYLTSFFYQTADFDPTCTTANLTSGGNTDIFIQKLSTGLAPAITSFTPTSGVVGTVVNIDGANFGTPTSSNTVRFNGSTAVVSASGTTSNISATVPSSATTGKISVRVGCNTATSIADFTVTTTAAPTITSFSPPSGPVGTTVIITGTNFSTTPSSNTVLFKVYNDGTDGSPTNVVAVVTASTATSITTVVPAEAVTGKISVTTSGGYAQSATGFIVTCGPLPTITSFTPISGTVGTTVVITGTDFSTTPSDNIVDFGGYSAVVIASTSTSITTSLPTGPFDNVPITITIACNTVTSSANFNVICLPPPTITSFTPGTGAVGDLVTITGTNFSANPIDNYVDFNGEPAIVTASTATSIITSVPASAFTGPISIYVGCDGASSPTDFIVDCGPVPTITSFSPTTGLEGSTVIISGTNFSTTPVNNLVDFNGVPAVVTASTATSISVMVPTGAINGPISILIDCNYITSATEFIVGADITITTQPADFIACAGQTATFTTMAFGTTNITYQWQFSVDGVTPFVDINDGGGYSGTATNTLTVNTAGNFGVGRYRCRINGDLAFEVISNDEGLFIIPTPTIPTVTSASRCGNGSVTLTASGGIDGEYRWYTAPTGGSAISGEVNSTYITPVLVSTTTYYVSLFNGSCESTRTPVLATITVQPVKPVIASSIAPVGNALTICSTTVLTLSAPNGFASYSWSTGGATSQITITATGTYSVTVTDGSGCASPASDAVIITVVSAPCNNQAPVIASSTTSTIIGGQATINLLDLITDADDNIVLTSLVILQSPSSGALATIANGILDIDYKGINFSGRDQLTIQVCDVFGECTQQILEIEVIGDIEVYNGISPNNDNQNEIFLIRNIDLLPDTQNNKVTIYNRWGSKVFEVSDYNNTTNVFKGLNENGSELPSGTYFFKIEFKSGRTAETGYLSLKR